MPRFDKSYVQYVHDKNKTVIGFDVTMGSHQVWSIDIGEIIEIEIEGFIYHCIVHDIKKVGKNYIYNLMWITNERRNSNN